MRLTALLWIAAVSGAVAEEYIREDSFEIYDLDSMSAGQYVESQTTHSSTTREGKIKSSKTMERLACVKADAEFVWLEVTKWTGDKPEDKQVELAQIRKTDRRIGKAWSGKPGAAGVEMKVTPKQDEPPTKPDKNPPAGAVSREKLKVLDKEYEAEKLVITVVISSDSPDAKKGDEYTISFWTSPDFPLRHRFQDADALERVLGQVAWDKKPGGPAGVLKSDISARGWSATTTVTGMGEDAKQTLQVK